MKLFVFEPLTARTGSPAHRRHGRQEVSIPECSLTGSASFIVIILLYEGLTHIQSQIKPRLLLPRVSL